MPRFQICEAMVAIGGDTMNVHHRGADTPVTYPELLVLQYIHDPESVSDVFELDNEERDNAAELERLRTTYGAKAVADVFPGARPRLPTGDSRIKRRTSAGKPKRKPMPDANDASDDEPANPGSDGSGE